MNFHVVRCVGFSCVLFFFSVCVCARYSLVAYYYVYAYTYCLPAPARQKQPATTIIIVSIVIVMCFQNDQIEIYVIKFFFRSFVCSFTRSSIPNTANALEFTLIENYIVFTCSNFGDARVIYRLCLHRVFVTFKPKLHSIQSFQMLTRT